MVSVNMKWYFVDRLCASSFNCFARLVISNTKVKQSNVIKSSASFCALVLPLAEGIHNRSEHNQKDTTTRTETEDLFIVRILM